MDENKDSLMDESNNKNGYTCVVDTIQNLLGKTDFPLNALTAEKLREAMPKKGQTYFVHVDLMLNNYGFRLVNVSANYCSSTGGTEYCVLQEKNCYYLNWL